MLEIQEKDQVLQFQDGQEDEKLWM